MHSHAGSWEREVKQLTGVIRVPEITRARRGCWRFVANGSKVCIPTQERGNELKALFSCTETCSGLDTTLVGNPKREVVTASGKRIDLVLESQDWVMVIENKIFHQQNNPFDDYERFVEDNKNDPRIGDKKPLYVVLSPTGEVARPNWIGIYLVPTLRRGNAYGV